MSKFGKKIIRKHLRRMVRKVAKRMAFKRMVRKGKKIKRVNFARPTTGGIMMT